MSSSPSPLRAVVCDRQVVVTRDLERTLLDLRVEPVGRALSLDAARSLAAAAGPDLLLLDDRLGPAEETAAFAAALADGTATGRPVAVVTLTTGPATSETVLAKPFSREALHAATEAALLDRAFLDAHAPVVPLADEAVDRVVAHLRREHARPVGLGELAPLVGMAPLPFARAYVAAAGSAPYQTLVECRVAEAERLLAATDLAVPAVARRVGFGSASAFEAAFEAVTDVPPQDYERVRAQTLRGGDAA